MSTRPRKEVRSGIDTQVLSVSQAQPYLPDPGAAAEAAKVANEEYITLCAAHRGRFLTFAAAAAAA